MGRGTIIWEISTWQTKQNKKKKQPSLTIDVHLWFLPGLILQSMKVGTYIGKLLVLVGWNIVDGKPCLKLD